MFIYNKHKMPKGNEIEISVQSLLEKLSSL
jgi:hypothetical protein